MVLHHGPDVRAAVAGVDVIDDVTVEAIVALAARAPGVGEWTQELPPVARALHESYLGHERFPDGLLPLKWHAYLPTFAPRYLPRVAHALQAAGLGLRHLIDLKGREGLRVLDLGCGPGTLGVACLNGLQAACAGADKTTRVAVVARDIDEGALAIGKEFVGYLRAANRWPNLEITWESQVRDLRISDSADDHAFDIVLLGHVCCELAHAHDENFTSELDRLAETVGGMLSGLGVAVIVEPSQADLLERFLTTRDRFRYAKGLTIFGPCLGNGMVCPEWERDAEGYLRGCSGATMVSWRPAGAGIRLNEFTRQLGRRYRSIGASLGVPSFFSCLVAGRGNRPIVPEGVGTTVRRWGAKGRCFICVVDEDGSERLVHRDTSASGHPGYTRYRTVRFPPPAEGQPGSDVFPMTYGLSALYNGGWPVSQ